MTKKITMPLLPKFFVDAMESKLQENSFKGDWEQCGFEYLYSRLVEEVGELGKAHFEGEEDAIIPEAADIANFAMMIADLFGIKEGSIHPKNEG